MSEIQQKPSAIPEETGKESCGQSAVFQQTGADANGVNSELNEVLTWQGFNCATLDPRNIPAAQQANDAVFSAGPVFGVEVTVPALAKRCAVNLDPQHSGANADRAAIEDAAECELPSNDMTLATVRADLDSIGAMAVLSMRKKGLKLDSAKERLAQIAQSDKFARGGYPGPQPLPTRESPWAESIEKSDETRTLAMMSAAVMDFKKPLKERVAVMETWLLTGDVPETYKTNVAKERMDLIIAIETGAIKHELRADGRIAVVETTHKAATTVGYSLAPVIVALNPAFKMGGGDAHVKFTICAFEPKFADIKSALAELAALEPGWGGSPTIGGSPQGVSSTLSVDQVAEIVEKYLK